jgi:hypothetical protein
MSRRYFTEEEFEEEFERELELEDEMEAAREPPTAFEDLPEEVQLQILRGVDVRTLSTVVPQVSRTMNRYVHDEPLWKGICEEDCGITELRQPTWRKELFVNYCKHFLSLDRDWLRRRFTPEYKRFLSESAQCSDITRGCSTKLGDDVWVCLHSGCQFYGCSRYKNKHALMHAKSDHHEFCVNWNKLDFWCYHCMRFVGSKNAKEKLERDRLRLLVGDPTNDKHAPLLIDL